MITKSAPAFSYWIDHGSKQIGCHPDPPTAEEARPFHVIGQNKHHIPISLLVFARSEEHAIERVRVALQEAHEKRSSVDDAIGRGDRLIAQWTSGELIVTATLYDFTQISAKVIWAGNGGIL